MTLKLSLLLTLLLLSVTPLEGTFMLQRQSVTNIKSVRSLSGQMLTPPAMSEGDWNGIVAAA